MKYPVFTIIITLLLLATACSDKRAQNSMTHVIGTPISLTLPSGFFADPAIAGFRHNVYQATIMVISVPLPYSEAILDLTGEKLQAVGQTLEDSESITIDGVHGILCKVYFQSQGLNWGQWKLVLPEEQNTITVSGTFVLEQEKDIAPTIKQSLLDLRIDHSNKPDPAVLGYTIQAAEDLKLAKVLEGPSVVYTHDGKWTNGSLFTYSLLCTTMPRSDTTITAPVVAMESFRQMCSTCDIEQQDSVTIDGLPAREIWGIRHDSVTRLKYQVIITDKSTCYYLIGTADENHRDRLENFRASARTWRRMKKR